MKKLTLIVAMTPSGLIGVDGKIPWHIPEDLKRFKEMTTGHAIIMGRKTFESIGRPLPNRTNIVVSRTPATRRGGMMRSDGELIIGSVDVRSVDVKPGTGLTVNTSVAEAIEVAHAADPSGPFVIGGAQVYADALAHVTHLEVTYVMRVDAERQAEQAESTRFSFLPCDKDAWWIRWSERNASYPSPWEWRCTSIARAADHTDVEYHSFERRTSP